MCGNSPPDIHNATAQAIETAARLLADDHLVAVPTETVYGLGASAESGQAVAKLYAAKGRPRFNPLIAHVRDAAMAAELAELPDAGLRLARTFWPGPLTLVLKRRADAAISDLATAGLDTVAVRVPAHPVMQALLTAFGRAIVAPSANRSGHVSATTARDVATDFDREQVAMILDGGPCQLGIESTIIDVTGTLPRLLRPGAIPRHLINAITPLLRDSGHDATRDDARSPRAPGMLESHYAPRASVRLNAHDVREGEALLAFGTDAPRAATTINLSPTGDLVEAAANLFSALRSLDATGAAAIAVMPVPEFGLGEAINDRLRRAAAPRSADTP